MILEVKDLVVRYGNAVALSNVSVNVCEGEIVTIIGANGAGKTTTLKAIAGLVRPTSGEIWFRGEKVDKSPAHRMIEKGIGICMEGRRLFPNMSVVENLEMGAYWRKDKDQISGDMENVFQLFPVLRDRSNQNAGALSGGEQQMLTIGRALMSNPQLLLLDEPSLGLAPLVVARLADVIKELNNRGLTVLLVEQNARMALALAHRGYVLEVGHITAEGDSQSLRSDQRVRKAYLGI